MPMNWKTAVVNSSVKALFRVFGLNAVRLHNVPTETFAGLRNRSIGTVIDCGANEGQFARYISRFFPKAALYCFEPLEGPFKALSAWAATQRGRVKCFNVALGEAESMAVMHHHLDHNTSSSLLAASEHELKLFPETARQSDVTVPVTTLDVVLKSNFDDLEPEILLKLDVQGYEDRVLRGAEQLLDRVRICLLEVDVDPLYDAQAVFKDLVLLLDRHGLRYAGNLDQSCAEDGRIMWLDAIFVRDQ
ncbi:MAG: FkbM family methyltransferase [Ktedonobacteraceae bacterium]